MIEIEGYGSGRTFRQSSRHRRCFPAGALFRAAVAALVLPLMVAILASNIAGAVAPELATDWVEGDHNRARLTAGAVESAAPGSVYAFFEITMDKGWKTYWRNPGSAGGIPPEFDWSKSRNVASVEVLYPVPKVISDNAGDVIGYMEHAVFPVRITPERPGEPVQLDVSANYGICKKLCVPVAVDLALTLPPGDLPPASPDGQAALDAVPRSADRVKPGDPSGFKAQSVIEGPDARVILKARFPGAADAAEVFLYIEDGRFIPMPVRQEAQGEVVSFIIDLSDPKDLMRVKGARVLATLKGELGQSESAFVID